jgi:oligopeptidase B
MINIKTIMPLMMVAVLMSCSVNQQKGEHVIPMAEKIEQQLIIHGDTRIDFYYWLRDRENPAVIDYLKAENEYLEANMSHTQDLQEEIFQEMVGRIKQDDSSAPYLKDGYYYYTRFEQGGEYPLYCRKEGSLDADEEIILNVPELAADKAYYRVGTFDVSPDNTLLAFTADTMGRRQYTIYIKDLTSGNINPTGIQYASGDVEWAADGQTIFFTTIDPVTLRYDNVRKYNTTVAGQPEVVYYEADETFYNMNVSKTKDDKYLIIRCSSTVTNEIQILESDNPTGSFRVFEPRQVGQEYFIEHFKGKFYVLTNFDAQNFRLMETDDSNTSRSNWKEVIGHRPDVLLESFEVFDDFLVLQERSNALQQMRIINQKDQSEHYIEFKEEAYTAWIHVNPEMNTDVFRFGYTSLTTPSSVYDYNMNTRGQNLVWQQTVLGDFSSENYETRRQYVEVRDGVKVPITMVYKKTTDLAQPNPLMQYAYGSYGSSSNPWFNSNVISLLDRGFIYVIAHVRGGQDMGRQWYEDGKFLKKINTFNDFVDVSEYLIENNYTTPEKLFASGGSAGGLLMGAIVNMRPELYKGVIAAVPFVDVVTTMLDETIPLTTSEYDEWGNPNDPEYYDYMLSYSPYDQVSMQSYPNLLITAGLHDSQVQYWEPAKWTAKLREYNTGDNLILLHTNLEAGHGGASGRFSRLREIAMQYAFCIDLVNN